MQATGLRTDVGRRHVVVQAVLCVAFAGVGTAVAQVRGIDGRCADVPGLSDRPIASSTEAKPLLPVVLERRPSGTGGALMGVGADTCATATVVTALPYSDTGDTCGFGDDYDETCGYDAPGSPDVVYAYTPTTSGCVKASVCSANTTYDTKMVVYESATGDPNDCGPYQSGSYRMCSDDTGSCPIDEYQSIIDKMYVSAGATYYIVVDGFGGDCGQYDLAITDCGCTPFPPNDSCAAATGAILADGVTVTFEGDNTCATNECSVLPAAGISGHTWESFTVPGPNHMDIALDYCGTTPQFELVWAMIFDGCPCEDADMLNQDRFDRETCGDGNATLFYNDVPPGTYYYAVMRVTDEGTYAEGPYQINVTGTALPLPTCGDNVVNQAIEECDGTDDTACPGQCRADCTCPPSPTCGDNVVNQASEACDGTDDGACPGECRADCTCPPPPTCGDNVVNQAGEECDGTDGGACPGRCQADCTCPPVGAIPAASAWGLITMTLLLLAGARVYFRRRSASATT